MALLTVRGFDQLLQFFRTKPGLPLAHGYPVTRGGGAGFKVGAYAESRIRKRSGELKLHVHVGNQDQNIHFWLAASPALPNFLVYISNLSLR